MGTEGIQDKYVNPYTDFGFKLLFGTAMNKESVSYTHLTLPTKRIV